MNETRDPSSPPRDAQRVAEACADRAGVRIRLLQGHAELRQAGALLQRVWGTAGEKVPHDLLCALTLSGNYVAGAWTGAQLVGAVVAFLGLDPGGRPILHSHIMGVVPQARGGVGFALKQHQRAWAIEHGLSEIVWTTDPLVRRNAYFNLAKLGADAVGYLTDMYGSMSDGLNGADATDRIRISWSLVAPKALRAAGGTSVEPDLGRARARGATVALYAGTDHEPILRDVAEAGTMRLIQVPEDIESLRHRDVVLARAWRVALREALGGLLRDGYQLVGFTRSGWYVLEADRGTGGLTDPAGRQR